MARRKDHTREQLKELAINAGSKLIINQGFGRFSAREVAREIGYTIGTIYNVFGNYDELILHINAKTLDLWYDYTECELKKTKGSKIKFLAKSYLEFSKENYNLWLALFEHHLPKDAEVPEWYQKKMLKLFGLVEQVILPEVNNNHKKAQQAAKVLWSGIHGIATLSHSGKLEVVGSDSAKVLADSLVENFMSGLTS
jgi:AcrR family transcriptional regulator